MSNKIDKISSEKIYDVRDIPCSEKHEKIFLRWSRLPVGDYFVLKNDHDPMPLQYQFEFIAGKAYSWEYLERGPLVFQIKIAKLGEIDESLLPKGPGNCGSH
jgi:uncharacterized protein (DUF2249 family)